MEELKNEKLNDEQLKDVSGGATVSDYKDNTDNLKKKAKPSLLKRLITTIKDTDRPTKA